MLGKSKLKTEFSVDTTGLFHKDTFKEIDDDNTNDNDDDKGIINPNKESLSELAKDLKTYIKLKGPITLHDYIAQALNHPLYGYYQHQHEKIGIIIIIIVIIIIIIIIIRQRRRFHNIT